MLADFNLRPELLFKLLTLIAQHGADRANGAAALTVDLENLELNLLAKQALQRLTAGHGGLRGRDKHLHTVGQSEHTALDDLGNNAVKNLFGLGCTHDLLEPGLGIKPLLGKHHGAFNIVDPNNQEFKLVPLMHNIFGFRSGVVSQFAERHITGMLGADINSDLVRGNAGDNAGNLLTVVCTFKRLIEHLFEAKLFLILIFQNLTHGFVYLLNYTGWR